MEPLESPFCRTFDSWVRATFLVKDTVIGRMVAVKLEAAVEMTLHSTTATGRLLTSKGNPVAV